MHHLAKLWVLVALTWQVGLAGADQAVSASKMLKMFQVERWTTPTGVPVMFLQRQRAPVVRISVVFDAGANRDGRHWGLANLTSEVMGQGTTSMVPEVLLRRLNDHGANWVAEVTRNATVVRLSVLREHVDASLKLFTQALHAPSFTNEVVFSSRSRLVHNLRAVSHQPMEQAMVAAHAAMFPGEGPVEGTPERLQALTPELCKKFYQRWWTRRHARLLVVGNLSSHQAHAITATLSASLPKGGAPQSQPRQLDGVQGKTLHLPLRTAQAAVVMMQRALPRRHPLSVDQWLVAKALGRSQGSVLYDALRGEHGWTYGTSAWVLHRGRGPQALVALWSSRPGVVEEAIQRARAAIERFRRDGLTVRRLRSIQREQLMDLYTTWSSQQGAMDLLVVWAEDGETPATFVAKQMRCQQATVEELQRALPTVLQPLNYWTTVVVGAPARHAPASPPSPSHHDVRKRRHEGSMP